MDKIFKDRYNHLNSQLKSAKGFKLDKTINQELVSKLEGQLLELSNIKSILIKKDLWIE